ncbi:MULTISPECIES: hypothetical protein [unclassified Janthinobacterium]|uniref:hypothetical protein n=1 Tax=unclassified Janthinobacterium TaxID=2610881 RepID=UPI0012F86C9E|nr:MULTISPECIES: hypothetical protein [unclassified Janthinobacterium]MEC5162572.1 hypothetical protein [Janthinobacterium sp. CG_S6]
MNASISVASNIAATSMESDERWQAVQRVLSSPLFVKAPRMRAMLSFLMIRKLSGMEESISEYAVGIEVFRRDARDYDTTTDPVVRVQMGRLRGRLAQYYATASNCGSFQIVIPPGTYVPELTPCERKRPVPCNKTQWVPLRVLTPNNGTNEFTCGLEEELALLLFQRFGNGQDIDLAQHHRIEVSVRVEQRRARASIRLIDAGTEDIVFLQQCDCYGDLGIMLQEELALEIFNILQKFMHSSQRSAQGRPADALWT